jgi:hypothetical protein
MAILSACNQTSDLNFKPGDAACDPVANRTSEVSWDQVSNEVFKPVCASCHGPSNTEGVIVLTDYEVVKNSIGTVFYLSTVSRQMPPPESGMKLTRQQKQLLSDWIIGGMKP